jgi:hypothetical protein
MKKVTNDELTLVVNPKTMVKAGFYGYFGILLARFCISVVTGTCKSIKVFKDAKVTIEEKENAECDA